MDLVRPALAAGWSSAQPCRPDEMLAGGAFLTLGGKRIPVRYVAHEASLSSEQNLALLLTVLDAMAADFFLEQFLVVQGYPQAVVSQLKTKAAAVRSRRLHIGCPAEYAAWLAERIHPLRAMDAANPVRKLLEPLLCVELQREVSKAPVVVKNTWGSSSIGASYALGAAGSTSLEVLLCENLGCDNVSNVEADKEYRKQDVDFLVRAQDAELKVEVKTEDILYGNLAYEWTSNLKKNTPGWLRYTTADVLVSILWPTGDVFVQGFKEVQAWIFENKRGYKLKQGWSKGQSYKSELYAGKIAHLFEDVKGVAHLSLHDWLPARTAAGEINSFLPAGQQGRSIKPQRLALALDH